MPGRCARRSPRPTRANSSAARRSASDRGVRAMRIGISTFSSGVELRQQMVELEDEADVAVAERDERRIGHRRDVDASQAGRLPNPSDRGRRARAAACSCPRRTHRRSPPSRLARRRSRDRAARECADCRRRRTCSALVRKRRTLQLWSATVRQVDEQCIALTRNAAPAPDRAATPGATDRSSRRSRSGSPTTTTSTKSSGSTMNGT